VIGDESDNTEQDTGTSDQAVSQGEERAGIPLLSALRQGVPEDILNHAYALVRANDGGPGVDGESFEVIESKGLVEWMNGLREDLLVPGEPLPSLRKPTTVQQSAGVSLQPIPIVSRLLKTPSETKILPVVFQPFP
jgi:hypothetical protein